MIETACAALLLMAAADPAPAAGTAVRVRMRERLIVRVPMRGLPAESKIEWREKKGPRCVPVEALAGAAVNDEDSVDIILRGGRRVRAKLDSACPALDFYAGFYVRSTGEDRMICSDRDSVHSRSGGECEIERFRALEPRVKR